VSDDVDGLRAAATAALPQRRPRSAPDHRDDLRAVLGRQRHTDPAVTALSPVISALTVVTMT
jgi:hypothetical protein